MSLVINAQAEKNIWQISNLVIIANQIANITSKGKKLYIGERSNNIE